jgi:aldehyde:ferredoxin oxidoreductase
MWGNTGRFIDVDLTARMVDIFSPPVSYYRKYIGGSGLAARLFWDRGSFSADPLSPEALLILALGPLAGLRLSGASRGCVAGCSPLTGHWGDSSCGGYFAPELRYAGYDGIMIRGKSEKPVVLAINDDAVQLVDAAEHWGKTILLTTSDLRKQFGTDVRTLAIGPAGENLVKYACILNEGHHAFGRAGFGAVMGSKNLKAIVVKGTKKELNLKDPDAFNALRRELNKKIKEALASNVLHENGTAANLEGGVHTGDVPIRNFQSNFWEEMAEALTGSTLTEKYLVHHGQCAFCGVACKRVVEVKEGAFAVPKGPGPEYETIVAFGALLGSMDLAATCKAGRVCNELGLDTITAGATIAWAMESFEKGALTLEDTGGIALQWGDVQTVIEDVLPAIAYRKGPLGKLLSQGSVSASRSIGKGSERFIVHSKGLEAPMHDPRGGGHGLALAYAISHRGACHVAYPMLFMEMGACYYPEIGFEYELEPMSDEYKAETACIASALGSIENSACYCQFADREISIPEWVALFNTVAGYDWDIDEMMKAGRRVFYLHRLLNYRYGLTAKDDSLSERLLQPAVDGAPEGIEINFQGMKDKFYDLMGLDPVKGVPSKQALLDHDMSEEYAALESMFKS